MSRIRETHFVLIGEWKVWTREVEQVQRLVLLCRDVARELVR